MRNRLLAGLAALAVVVLGGTLGFQLIGDGRWNFSECMYFVFITVTTVGYGEVLPGMDQMPVARWFTIVLLVFGTGVLVYFASTITAFIVEGDGSRHALVVDISYRGRDLLARRLFPAEILDRVFDCFDPEGGGDVAVQAE